MEICTSQFDQLAQRLGGVDCAGPALVTFTSPFSLDSWSQPLIELTLILGAVASLVHAVRWKRAHDDPANLVVWLSGVVTLFLLEPVCYFPQWFGLEEKLGLTFVHNQFTVQFFFNRLPLYIVAMYPVFAYVAYVLVQRTGIFERFHPLVGAVSVGMTFHVFYEAVDMVGPQYGWWVWNPDFPVAEPSVGGVPIACLLTFSFSIPAASALLARWTAGPGQSGWRVVRNLVVTSLGTFVFMFATNVPGIVLDLVGFTTREAQRVAYWAIVLGGGALTIWAYVAARRARPGDVVLSAGVDRDRFAPVCAIVYLAVVVVLWAFALPDHLAARDGLTAAGLAVGSLPYAAVCGGVAVLLLALAVSGRPPAQTARRPSAAVGAARD